MAAFRSISSRRAASSRRTLHATRRRAGRRAFSRARLSHRHSGHSRNPNLRVRALRETLPVCGEQVEGSGAVFGGGPGVAAGGLEAGVAEELGDDDEVCPSADEGCGEAVP